MVVEARIEGAIGCTQLDFFIQLVGLSGPLLLDQFALALRETDLVFRAPGVTEAEVAFGLNFYNPFVSVDGRTLIGTFDFGAFLDPDITNTLRARAEMASVPPSIMDATGLPFDYALTAAGNEIARGSVDAPPVTATPEPATIMLVASGFAGIGAWRRRTRAAMRKQEET